MLSKTKKIDNVFKVDNSKYKESNFYLEQTILSFEYKYQDILNYIFNRIEMYAKSGIFTIRIDTGDMDYRFFNKISNKLSDFTAYFLLKGYTFTMESNNQKNLTLTIIYNVR